MEPLNPNPDFITVPRSALQALAEWAYPGFSDRTWAKLPAQHPRWTSHNIHDDMLNEGCVRSRRRIAPAT